MNLSLLAPAAALLPSGPGSVAALWDAVQAARAHEVSLDWGQDGSPEWTARCNAVRATAAAGAAFHAAGKLAADRAARAAAKALGFGRDNLDLKGGSKVRLAGGRFLAFSVSDYGQEAAGFQVFVSGAGQVSPAFYGALVDAGYRVRS